MRLTFLGTGTSFGVPQIGCDCAVCRSTDPRDRRTRVGARWSRRAASTILIDTPPELRLQLIAARRRPRVDAVLYTHEHADHVNGIDDLRIFSVRQRRALPVYGPPETLDRLRAVLPLHLRRRGPAVRGHLEAAAWSCSRSSRAGRSRWPGVAVLPLAFQHGHLRVFGYRFGAAGVPHRREGDRRGRARPAPRARGAGAQRALVAPASDPPQHRGGGRDARQALGARRTYLTHLTHETGHAELAAPAARRHRARVRRPHRGGSVMKLRVRTHAAGPARRRARAAAGRLAELAAPVPRGPGRGAPPARGRRVRLLSAGRPGRDRPRDHALRRRAWARPTTTCSCSASAARRWAPRRCSPRSAVRRGTSWTTRAASSFRGSPCSTTWTRPRWPPRSAGSTRGGCWSTSSASRAVPPRRWPSTSSSGRWLEEALGRRRHRHLVFTTDPDAGALREIAAREGIATLERAARRGRPVQRALAGGPAAGGPGRDRHRGAAGRRARGRWRAPRTTTCCRNPAALYAALHWAADTDARRAASTC